jgi:hypothetical protein
MSSLHPCVAHVEAFLLPLFLPPIEEISMKSKLALGAVVAAIAVFSQTAFAQAAASAPVTREQRKADTAAANKAGQLAPAGEGKAGTTQPSTATDKTRTDRKAQTEADIKSGNVAPAGQGPGTTAKPSTTTSDKTREQRKAQTEADKKAGKLTAPGQAAEQK